MPDSGEENLSYQPTSESKKPEQKLPELAASSRRKILENSLAKVKQAEGKVAFDESNDRSVIVGDEIISPRATRPEERNPDGSVNFKPAEQRGWLSAIANANARKDISRDEQLKNVQAIVDAAINAGVPRDAVGEHLKALGIKAAPREEIAAEQMNQFDSNKPISGATYNELTKRFNDIRSRVQHSGDK